jgi:hypothetical protein
LPDCGQELNATVSGSDLESKIASVWKEVLQVKTLSLDDNFFDIGGHSLLMVRVYHMVQPLLGRDFPVVTMLEHPTILSVARHLADGHVSSVADYSTVYRFLRRLPDDIIDNAL